MSVQSIKSIQDSEILLAANHQLEQMYFVQKNPCLALHISRNYHLLHSLYEKSEYKNQWKDKVKIWWSLYWEKHSNRGLELFYGEDDLVWGI